MNTDGVRQVHRVKAIHGWQFVPVIAGLFILILMLANPAARTNAAALFPAGGGQAGPGNPSLDYFSISARQEITQTLTPTATATETETPTATATETGAPTATPTPTGSASPTASPTTTATATATATASATATVTNTPTATVTGTPPTATRTSTATSTPGANLTITNVATPTTARTNENISFAIKVTNSGSSEATNVQLSTSFTEYFDLGTVTSTKSTHTITRDTTARTVTVAMGSMAAAETQTITIVVKVNSSVRSEMRQTNTAFVTYTYGSSTRTVSAAAAVTLQPASGLPGTGGMEIERQPGGGLFWPALFTGLVLIVLAGFALGYSAWARNRRPAWAAWYARTGLILLAAGIVFGLAAYGLRQTAPEIGQSGGLLSGLRPSQEPASYAWLEVGEEPWGIFLSPDEPEKLPDYPVPTPEFTPTAAPGEPQPDTSSVVHITIPSIGVDTVVKYVPFDGLTWMIGGLRQEVAWMGDTSWPGLGGNTGLAGHITLHNGSDGPFRHLADLLPGQEVIVYTENNVYTYKVREQVLVDPYDLSVVQPSSGSQLTLITCAAWDKEMKTYQRRLIVYSDLVDTKPRGNQTASR